MQHRTGRRGALQEKGKERVAGRTLHRARAAILFALLAGLQACSSNPEWPTLGKISDLDNILTTEQRQKAVQDLQKNDANHDKDTAAAKTAPSK
jgi:uncharacterized membrane protein YgcG